jgi:hypothetical protein
LYGQDFDKQLALVDRAKKGEIPYSAYVYIDAHTGEILDKKVQTDYFTLILFGESDDAEVYIPSPRDKKPSHG